MLLLFLLVLPMTGIIMSCVKKLHVREVSMTSNSCMTGGKAKSLSSSLGSKQLASLISLAEYTMRGDNMKTDRELLELLRNYARTGHPGKMGRECMVEKTF